MGFLYRIFEFRSLRQQRYLWPPVVLTFHEAKYISNYSTSRASVESSVLCANRSNFIFSCKIVSRETERERVSERRVSTSSFCVSDVYFCAYVCLLVSPILYVFVPVGLPEICCVYLCMFVSSCFVVK